MCGANGKVRTTEVIYSKYPFFVHFGWRDTLEDVKDSRAVRISISGRIYNDFVGRVR